MRLSRRHAPRALKEQGPRWALWAAFWIVAGLLLAAIGVFIATALESPLLGFLGADFVFLVAVSIYMSGQRGPDAGRR